LRAKSLSAYYDEVAARVLMLAQRDVDRGVLDPLRQTRIRDAIKRASGRDATNYHQSMYEAYAPHGVALLVETATDNPTRTVAHVRNIITKHGGNLSTSGSVAFQFRKMGVFRLDPAGIDQDELELDMIDHGLQEMGESSGEKGEPQLVLRCDFADFGQLQEALEARGVAPLSAEHEYVPAADRAARGAGGRSARLIDLPSRTMTYMVFHTLA
jgi:transcriptional/translational regulatory protein YebC/TACO1